MDVDLATFAGLIIGLCYMAAAPFAAFWLFGRAMKLAAINVFLGAAAFFLFFKVIPPLNEALAAYASAAGLGRYFVVVAGLVAFVVLAETLRYAALRFLGARSAGPEAGVSLGIGYGACQVVATLLIPQISMLRLAVRLSNGDLSPASPNFEAMARILGPALADGVGKGIVAIVLILVEIAVSTLVWIGLRDRNIRWIVAALALHVAYLLPIVFMLGAAREQHVTSQAVYHEILGLLIVAWVAVGGKIPLFRTAAGGAKRAAGAVLAQPPGLFRVWSAQRARGDAEE